MSHTLQVTIQVTIDSNQPFAPITQTYTLTEVNGLVGMQQPADNGASYHQLPGSLMATLNALMVSADQPFNMKLNNGSTVIPLNSGGILLLLNGNIAVAAATNATINIPGSSNANLTVLTGGSG